MNAGFDGGAAPRIVETPNHKQRVPMRDQLTALSYAAAISGGLLLILEWMILDDATFWQTFPYMFAPFVAGLGGLYWFRIRKPASPTAALAAEAPPAAAAFDTDSEQ